MAKSKQPKKQEKPTQICTQLDRASYGVVERMAAALGRTRAWITADLVAQGIAALRAAAAAEDRGEDRDVAAVEAVRAGTARTQADEATMLALLDGVDSFLAGVADRHPALASDLADRAGNALKGWATQFADGLSEQDRLALRLEEQRLLSERMIVREG